MRLTVIAAVALFTAAATSPARAEDCSVASAAKNIAVVKDFYSAYESGDAALMTRTLASDFVSVPLAPGAKPGLEGALGVLARTHAAFSDIHVTNEEFITSGSKVVVRSTIRANQTGPFMGVPATGKPISFTAIDIQTVCGGKIVRSDHEEGWLPLLFQLGVLPPRR